MKRFKQYLFEKTFDLNKDVDYIYKMFFKKRIDLIKKGEYNFPLHPQEWGYISSEELKTKTAKMSHEVNPITIYAGIMNSSNYYDTINNKIILTLNFQAVQFYLKCQKQYGLMKPEQAADFLPKNQQKNFINEFEETSIKSSIYHELSHWANDSLHNKNISYIVKKASEYVNKQDIEGARKVMSKGYKDINITDIEIDAQIHSLKQIKLSYKNKYDSLTIYDLMDIKPAFNTLFSQIIKLGEKTYTYYMKKLFIRMSRENLIGKKMKIISYLDMYKHIGLI